VKLGGTWAQYLHIIDGAETAAPSLASDNVPFPFTPFSACGVLEVPDADADFLGDAQRLAGSLPP